jgi:hypothetical protein
MLPVTATYPGFSNTQKFTLSSQTLVFDEEQSKSVTLSVQDDIIYATYHVSIDVSQVYAPRKADGSLPDITFGKPAPGSDLIDAGVGVELP